MFTPTDPHSGIPAHPPTHQPIWSATSSPIQSQLAHHPTQPTNPVLVLWAFKIRKATEPFLFYHFHLNLKIQNSWPHWSSTSTSLCFHRKAGKGQTNLPMIPILPAEIQLCAQQQTPSSFAPSSAVSFSSELFLASFNHQIIFWSFLLEF